MKKYLKDRPWLFFMAVAAIALVFYCSIGPVLAELVIAAVIYYEIEENRIAAFLAEVQGKAYDRRKAIYEAYSEAQGQTLEEKALAFRDVIFANPNIRSDVDYALTYFSNAHYLVRRSLLHRKLLSEWFPQTIIRMWAMLSGYVVESERRGIELAKETISSVDALLAEKKFAPIAISAGNWENKLSLSADDLSKLKASAILYLEQNTSR